MKFNKAVEFKDDASETPKGKNIDFVAKIAFALHIIVIPEEINLLTLLNAASYVYHMDEVKEVKKVMTPSEKWTKKFMTLYEIRAKIQIYQLNFG